MQVASYVQAVLCAVQLSATVSTVLIAFRGLLSDFRRVFIKLYRVYGVVESLQGLDLFLV